MQKIRLCKNSRSEDVSDERGKGKLWSTETHVKIGHLEFLVISTGVCDCDPALGAASILTMESTCLRTIRQPLTGVSWR